MQALPLGGLPSCGKGICLYSVFAAPSTGVGCYGERERERECVRVRVCERETVRKRVCV